MASAFSWSIGRVAEAVVAEATAALEATVAAVQAEPGQRLRLPEPELARVAAATGVGPVAVVRARLRAARAEQAIAAVVVAG